MEIVFSFMFVGLVAWMVCTEVRLHILHKKAEKLEKNE